MFAGGAAEGNVPLAAWAIKTALRDVESAERTLRERFGVILCLDRSPGDLLNLLLELGGHLIDVLRPNQNT